LNEYYNGTRKQVPNTVDGADDAEIKKGEDAAGKIVYSGFVAQEVEAAAEKFNYEFSGVDKPHSKDGLYGLRYDNFIVPLVKAVQELSQQNDNLKKENEELKSRLDKMEAIVLKSQYSIVDPEMAAKLEQNMPNPSNGTTTIGYYLPSNHTHANINLYSSNGSLLKSVRISGNGKGMITVRTNELAAGIYQYALIINRKVVDSKKMVLIK